MDSEQRVHAVIEVEKRNFLPPKLPRKGEKVGHEFMYILYTSGEKEFTLFRHYTTFLFVPKLSHSLYCT